MPVFLRISLLLLYGIGAQASDGYCLSGGFRNAYSCEEPLTGAASDTQLVYSVQLLERVDETLLSGRADVTYVTQVNEDKRLVYIGQYPTQAQGLEALQAAVRDFGTQRFPMLVELSLAEPLARIRLVAEPNVAQPSSGKGLQAPSGAAVSDASLPALTGKPAVYAVQLAVFKGRNDAARFTNSLKPLSLNCRQKDNGLHAVYSGRYDTYDQARVHRDANPSFERFGGYIVKLRDVEFSRCERVMPGQLPAPEMDAPKPSAPPTLLATDRSPGPQDSLPKAAASELNTATDAQYDLVYSIQVAAFDRSEGGQRLARKHPQIPLSCRVRTNGLFTVYYGVYQDYASAKQHLQDYNALQSLGAYIVKLRDVSFMPCSALAAQIEQSQR